VPLRIASVNAWGGRLFDELIEWLPGSRAHIVCLQEVTRTPGLTGWTRFEDGERTLPQRADLFDDVCTALPRHEATFVASDSGPVQDDTGVRHRQDFGLATLVAAQMPVVEVASAFVHGQFVDHVEWTVADRPRIALAVRTVDRAGRSVWVVQIHGLRDPIGKADTPARRGQAQRLAEFVRRIRGPRDLVVVCGACSPAAKPCLGRQPGDSVGRKGNSRGGSMSSLIARKTLTKKRFTYRDLPFRR